MKNLIRFVDLIQGSPEWLEFRKFKIGSSMVSSIRGVGFRTPLQLFEDIVQDREIPDNEAMRRGREMEPVIREHLNQELGIELKPVVVQHPEYDWHISSIDGIYLHEHHPFVVEIKHPGKVDHEMALDGIVPEKYRMQCLHILEDLPGVERMLYCSYRNENSVAKIWVERDEKEMAVQLIEEQNFYSNLLMFRPPDPTSLDWIEFFAPTILEKAYAFSSLQEQIKSLEEKAKSLKEEIIEETRFASRAKIGDLRLQKVIRPGAIDYSKIEALQGIDLGSYRKDPVVSWRLS